MKNTKVNKIKKSMAKFKEILSKEFPYARIVFEDENEFGTYYVSLDYINEDDVDKFIDILHESSLKHGVGVGVPVIPTYKKILETA